MYVSVGMCQDGNQRTVGRLQTMWRKTWEGGKGRMLQQPNMCLLIQKEIMIMTMTTMMMMNITGNVSNKFIHSVWRLPIVPYMLSIVQWPETNFNLWSYMHIDMKAISHLSQAGASIHLP